MRDEQSGAQRAARVAGGRLDEQPVESRLAPDTAVRNAIERHAAGHHQVLGARQPGDVGHELEHRLFDNLLHRGRQVHFASRDLRFPLAWRSAKQVVEALVGHALTVEIAEVARIETKRAVVQHVDQLLADQIGVLGFAVGRQAHQLVLARVDLEAAIVGKCAIQKSQRVGVANLLEQLDLASFAVAERASGPLAHAVDGQDRRFLERRGVEATGGVCHVMLRDQQSWPLAEDVFQLGEQPSLDAQEGAARLDELVFAAGRLRDGVFNNAVKRQQGAVVKHDRGQLRRLDKRLAEAVVDRAAREARIVFFPGKSLLLSGCDNIAPVHQRCGSVVVVS